VRKEKSKRPEATKGANAKEASSQNGRITHSRAAIETPKTIAPAYDEASSAAFLLGTPSSLPISYSSFDEHRSQSTARN
jgi:hypothetical protein